jgi:hypothetical protein
MQCDFDPGFSFTVRFLWRRSLLAMRPGRRHETLHKRMLLLKVLLATHALGLIFSDLRATVGTMLRM